MNRALTDNSFSPTLRTIGRTVLPSRVRQALWTAAGQTRKWRSDFHLARLRRRLYSIAPGSDETEQLLHYTVRINNGPMLYYLYRDIFLKRIYHFKALRPDPLILDLGSNIGISILYFKHIYPQARIIGFEPDPLIFPYLEENVAQNGLADVQLVQAAVAGQEGVLMLCSDGLIGSSLEAHLPGDIEEEWVKYQVPCVRLRDYLTEPVDFLKMNIESAEWEVLADSEDCLHYVREMVIEYHHLPGIPRTLHKILGLLHQHRFEYVVSDFGFGAYGLVRPPIHLHPETRYFRHIYACKME